MRFSARLLFPLILCALAPAAAHAQSPEGPLLPVIDPKIGIPHGQVRLGYYPTTHTFRYQGEYTVTASFAHVNGSSLYAFADVDVEAGQDAAHSTFRPQRLVGTFEVGATQFLGVRPLSLLVRHQSAHYIDREDLFQGSWDMVALRYQKRVGRTDLAVTLANYVHVHQLASEYKNDADIQGETALGATRGHKISLRTDLHIASGHGGRGGFADYWIEPSLALSAQSALFVGYGQITDTNLSAANTDHPVMAGVRFNY